MSDGTYFHLRTRDDWDPRDGEPRNTATDQYDFVPDDVGGDDREDEG